MAGLILTFLKQLISPLQSEKALHGHETTWLIHKLAKQTHVRQLIKS
jgi:hypothetical protein